MTFPSPWATASGVFISVIARPNGAAIIREEQNFRKARRLIPHRIRLSSMVSTTLEEATRGARMRSPPNVFCVPLWANESQPYVTSVLYQFDTLAPPPSVSIRISVLSFPQFFRFQHAFAWWE